MKILAIYLLLATSALADERADYCDGYSKNVARLVVPMVIERARAICNNSEIFPGPALPRDWITALRLIDPTPADLSCIGTVPATDRPPPAVPAKTVLAKPPPLKVNYPSPPAEFCAKAHRHIIWSGRSWRCQ